MLNQREMKMKLLNVGLRRLLVTLGQAAPVPVMWTEARKQDSEAELREEQENRAELIKCKTWPKKPEN